MNRSRAWLSVLAVVLLMSFVAACGDDSDGDGESADTTEAESSEEMEDEAEGGADAAVEELVTAAQDEGSLVWYSVPAEPIAQAVSDAFADEYGIEVEFQRLASSDLSARYASEAETGDPVADVVVMSNTPFVAEGASNGWFVPLSDTEVPGYPGEWPEEFVLDDRGTAVISIEPSGISFNTDQLGDLDPPETWADLAEPDWEGKILLADPAGSPAYIDFWTVVLDAEGPEVLEGIGANAAGTYPSAVPLHEALGAGEGTVGVPGVGSIVAGISERGAPVEFVIPDLTTGPEIVPLISEGAAHPNAARLFVWWLMFGGGEEVLNALPTTASPGTGEDMPADYTRNPPDAQDNRDEILQLLGVG
jgi:iron(III) transport system substrate-binding protein